MLRRTQSNQRQKILARWSHPVSPHPVCDCSCAAPLRLHVMVDACSSCDGFAVLLCRSFLGSCVHALLRISPAKGRPSRWQRRRPRPRKDHATRPHHFLDTQKTSTL